MSAPDSTDVFGEGDASYRAAGGREGLERLARRFYETMGSLPEASAILAMHPQDLARSQHKLAAFLSGWLGGPKAYTDEYGPIRIPAAHAHLAIDEAERDAWMRCMQLAVDEQPWSPSFKAYFLRAIAVPAERVRAASVAARAARAR